MTISDTLGNVFGGKGNSTDTRIANIADNAHAKVGTLADKAHDVVKKVEPAVAQVTARAHAAIDNTAGAAAPAIDYMADRARALDQKQQQVFDDARKCVSGHPLKSILLAAAAGFLLSKI